jgi:hypothetical protein
MALWGSSYRPIQIDCRWVDEPRPYSTGSHCTSQPWYPHTHDVGGPTAQRTHRERWAHTFICTFHFSFHEYSSLPRKKKERNMGAPIRHKVSLYLSLVIRKKWSEDEDDTEGYKSVEDYNFTFILRKDIQSRISVVLNAKITSGFDPLSPFEIHFTRLQWTHCLYFQNRYDCTLRYNHLYFQVQPRSKYTMSHVQLPSWCTFKTSMFIFERCVALPNELYFQN